MSAERAMQLAVECKKIVQEEINKCLQEALQFDVLVSEDPASVGVMGDYRTYERFCIIQIDSGSLKKEDWENVLYGLLGRISSRIVNELEGVNRVTYDITPRN